MTNIYQQNGHVSREAYLESLAEDYEVSIRNVHMLADLLGPDEDFDGLVTSLEDYASEMGAD
jgi:hypothetical protein